jgi:predicted dehydrogenase
MIDVRSGRVNRRAFLGGAVPAALLGAELQPALRAVRLPRKIRLGILGLEGHADDEILAPLPLLPDVRLVAASDPDPGRLKEVAGRAVKCFADWRQMLDQTGLDTVAVCNNNGERAAAVLACIERGLNVIAEKPLALTMADIHTIRAAAERRGVHVGVLLPMRFEPGYLMLRRVVREGLIGEVAQIAGQKSYKSGHRPDWYLKRASFGDTIPWIGPHMIDLMRFTSGREFREVMSFAANVQAPELGEMDNVAASLFRLDNGGVATMRLDYLRPAAAFGHGDDRLRLAGTRGIVEYSRASGVTLVTRDKPLRRLPNLPNSQRSVFVDFLESAYAGKDTGLSLPEIVRLHEIVLAAQEAARTGRLIRL